MTLGMGGLGLFAPDRAAAFTRISPLGVDGRSEIRATYGGLFAALGLCCLAAQSDAVFLTAGVAWLGAAAGRIASVAMDRNHGARNLGAVAFEAAIGIPLLLPMLAGG
ncbi:MAG: DUF4345 family protein [Gammaproteobacteria bacterium]